MKTYQPFCYGSLAVCLSLWMTGCQDTRPGITSPYHAGPTVGRTVGYTAGVVAGNAAGAAVGVGEGAVAGVAAPFNPTTRLVRRWETQTTPDGRTIQVPVDVLVDQYGRPVSGNPAPAGTPAPAPSSSQPAK